MKRIGRRVVVSFPNFGHWKIRLQLLLSGRMPVTRTLADEWYDTPNIHLCTVRDFLDLCEAENLAIEKALMLAGDTSWTEHNPGTRANLRAEQAVFLLYRK
jgi:methionine biosynthesis protein MetW